MGIPRILALLLGLLTSVADAGNDCSTSFCGNNDTPVRFPFKFTLQSRKECGYPGFDLGCDFNDMITLKLPHSGDFFVRDINYLSQEIQLFDPQGCLPRRLLSLNLSSSPFYGTYYNNYTFLGCPPDLDRSLFDVVDCLSNSTVSILATSSMAFVKAMNTCNVIATVPVPSSWSFQNNGIGYSSDLTSGDLFLSWKEPDCRICDAKGGSCGFFSSSSMDVACTVSSPNGSRRGQALLKIVGFSVFLPFVILPALFICLVCFKCFLAREEIRLRQTNNNNLQAPSSNSSRYSSAIPQTGNAKAGLDDSVIESCPKLILDENCSNLEGSKDLGCPICLDEYQAKDTLRCIPKCEHYFHIECIDKWLKVNGTCPVCRTSPFNVVVAGNS